MHLLRLLEATKLIIAAVLLVVLLGRQVWRLRRGGRSPGGNQCKLQFSGLGCMHKITLKVKEKKNPHPCVVLNPSS